MKIYTRTGDQGETSLFGGTRVAKTDARISAFGTLDELNAILGLAQAAGLPDSCRPVVEKLQHQLFDLGAELATPDSAERGLECIDEIDVTDQESTIDALEGDLSPLKSFVLPGGTQSAALLHLARCVCRRGEREIVSLSQVAPVRETVLKFINRTSDLLFVLARKANAEAGTKDTTWKKSR